jgi:hypothetical protein
LLIKNKENSLKNFPCKKIPWKKIPWKQLSLQKIFLGNKFLEKNSLETTFLVTTFLGNGVPWKKIHCSVPAPFFQSQKLRWKRTRFSWSELRSNKIVNKNQDRGWMRDGPRCSKQVSVKSDLLLPPTKFSKVYFFQRLSTSRIFWYIFRAQISFTSFKALSRI